MKNNDDHTADSTHMLFMPIISEMLLPEFDEEMKKTRTTLERVPVDKPAVQGPESNFVPAVFVFTGSVRKI